MPGSATVVLVSQKTKALAQVALEADSTAHVLEAVEQVNKQQKLVLANRIISHLVALKGKRVALWGLAFKKYR